MNGRLRKTGWLAVLVLHSSLALAQPAPTPTRPGPFGPRGPVVVSPELLPDGRVTFRVLAPNASKATVTGEVAGGMVADPNAAPPAPPAPGAGPVPFAMPQPIEMVKGQEGVWSVTTPRAVKPGAWRYAFNVDGATVVDSRNVRTSPSQTQVQSLLVVPGDFSETRDVPHGTVGLVRYVSKSLGDARRELYVYTPPGYEKSGERCPVLYLIHGGGDTAASWSTIGRANDILDNLLAEKKAVPMIVVMPSGWTPSGGQVMTSDATKDPFTNEMITDIVPMIDARYRTLGTPDSRALSGLSMGGIQTLNIGLHHLGTFRYLAVMSSGWTTPGDREFFYRTEGARFAAYNDALKLFWWGWGETDIARANGLDVIGRLKSQGVRIETRETPGGHEWANWRLYLSEVAQKLFR